MNNNNGPKRLMNKNYISTEHEFHNKKERIYLFILFIFVDRSKLFSFNKYETVPEKTVVRPKKKKKLYVIHHYNRQTKRYLPKIDFDSKSIYNYFYFLFLKKIIFIQN